ncbi:HAMP domain-containing histidine kinase [Actinoplanes sp. TBRC 11911]|uniref:sensor histidine kinase n=1 Tax=Actinoplanes sp. TBRC 11911 TaxID=2729386 RepID=UPI00145F010B|nr:HAMP domain-containing sensor histidine kinase [Actinoplanes sp. TBRC 11911]NMO57261.1 HAMP domain-containing histidine kinase [Actinoplanes sp. TBRC 11911]
MNRADPDRLLLRRARRTLALQNAAAITLVLLIVGAVALIVVSHSGRRALERSLQRTAATEEDVTDPPIGSWIFRLDAAGRLQATPGAPAGFPDVAALRDPGGLSTKEIDGTTYLVETRRKGTMTVQVVGSLAASEAERRRLLVALGAAEVLGLGVSAAAGILLARRAIAPLGDALARQRRFVADAGHELRTPLAQLHTRVQLLDRDMRAGATAEDIGADVEHLLAGTRQLGDVVDDLLLSTQLPAVDSVGEEVDLAVLAAGVVTSMNDRASQLGVELVLEPDPDQPSLVRGRPTALRRVVTALVDNALSHTAAGGHVAIELRTDDGRVTMVVRDDGSGFDPADTQRIFDRFARGHDDRHRFGLGLALAREVVTGHGGTIEAASTPGQGAVFTIRLPSLG